MTNERPPTRGRRRDPGIDERVLAVAGSQLAASGYEAMSIAAVANAAGTTRQAVYRRWPTKASLAAAALPQAAEETAAGADSDDPFRDLVDELANFQWGVSLPGRMSLVGTMLQDGVDPAVRARYQERVIAPRRRRLRSILERARDQGLIDADADLDIAVTLGTGAWYARALAGLRPPSRWPERTAALVWRAVGGDL